MASITLDVVVEENLEEFIANTEKAYSLELTVLSEHGPAGGWPVIKFEGHHKRVEAYLRAYTDHDKQDFEFYREQISE